MCAEPTRSDTQYDLVFDLEHSDISKESTNDSVHVWFWSELGDRSECPNNADKMFYNDEYYCYLSNEARVDGINQDECTFSVNVPDAVNVGPVIIEIRGEDALFIDAVKFKEGNEVLQTWGADGGEGWCLSREGEDANGSWNEFLGSEYCSEFILFNIKDGSNEKCRPDTLCTFDGFLSQVNDLWYHEDRYLTPATVEWKHEGDLLDTQDRTSRAPHTDYAFRFNSADNGTLKWRPQGITGFTYEEKKYVAVSWYGRKTGNIDYMDRGTRITLNDVTDTSSASRYSRILLVDEHLNTFYGWKAGGIAYKDGFIHAIDDRERTEVHKFPINNIEKVNPDVAFDYSYIIRRTEHYFVEPEDGKRNGDFMENISDLGDGGWFLFGQFDRYANKDDDMYRSYHTDFLANKYNNRNTDIKLFNPETNEIKTCNGPFLQDMQGATWFQEAGEEPIMAVSSSWRGYKESHLHLFNFDLERDCQDGVSWSNLAYTIITLPAGSEDLWSDDEGYVWTVTEFSNNPDEYGGQNNREVFRYKKSDLTEALYGAHDYTFVVDFKRRGIVNEHTSSETCAHFYSHKGQRLSCPNGDVTTGDMEYCLEGTKCLSKVKSSWENARYTIPGPVSPISTVILETTGDDNLYVDYAWLENDFLTKPIRTFGENAGEGWCLSTDAGVVSGGWTDYVVENVCATSIIFDIELGDPYVDSGAYQCPASEGSDCYDHSFMFNKMAGED